MLKEFTMLYVINILYYLIADLDLLLVISCYSKLCYGVKIVLSQDEYLLPTTSKPLIYLCFLRSYNYTPTKSSWTAQVHDDFFMLRIKKSSFTCSVTPPLKLTIAAAGLWFCFQFQQLIYSVHMAQAKGLEIERFRVLF